VNTTTMQTFSGKLIDLAKFTHLDVRLADISHALSMINRFTGHSTSPYSVAQHSVHVSRLLPDDLALWGLLHDASEAYLGDVATPLKSLLPCYQEIEERVQRAVARAFGMRWPIPEPVKLADRAALAAEKAALFSVQHDWGLGECMPARIGVPLPWYEAKSEFESRFKEIVK
jgi:5'-deoxynucleotidase YfbR-like HD superfamily hydrolase